jgi:hypothetical protein
VETRQGLNENIGQSADQTLTGLAVSEHIVVSVFANTPIYLILDREAKRETEEPGPPSPSHVTAATSANSVESLRQLLQLQRELNQSVDPNTH